MGGQGEDLMGSSGHVGAQRGVQLDLYGRPVPVLSEIQKRDRGMAVAAAKNAEYLELFRLLAVALTPVGDYCHIDIVRESAKQRGDHFVPGNWQGSVFKTPRWQYVDMIPSRHVGGHGRRVMRWRRLW